MKFRIVCAKCGKHQRTEVSEGLEDESVNVPHGLCDDCKKNATDEFDGKTLKIDPYPKGDTNERN